MSDPSLLDASALGELEALARRLGARARSGATGSRIARRRGSSAEFEEHRGYEPGDDPRRIDWLATARLGRPMVKIFAAEEDVVVRLFVDASASMAAGGSTKIASARRIAAALGYLALAGSERAELVVGRQNEAMRGRTHRGRGSAARLVREIAGFEANGTLDLASALRELLVASKRAGLLVVISDFFDAGPVSRSLSMARAAGHDVALIHLLSPEDASPALEGDCALVDSETGEVLDVTIDAAVLDAHAARLATLESGLRAWAKGHGATYVRGTTEELATAVVRRVVGLRNDRTGSRA